MRERLFDPPTDPVIVPVDATVAAPASGAGRSPHRRSSG